MSALAAQPISMRSTTHRAFSRSTRTVRRAPSRWPAPSLMGNCARSLRDGLMNLFLASVGFGLITSAVLAIAAVGFTLQFAVTDVLNLAFAAVMTAGAFTAYLVNQAGYSIWLGLVAALVAGALLSVLLNYLVYTPFQRRGSAPITLVIVSLGMALIIEFGIAAIVGGVGVSYRMSQGSTVKAGGLVLTTVQLTIIAISLVVMAGVAGLLKYSKLGK